MSLAAFLDAMQRPAAGEDGYELELLVGLAADERRAAEDLLIIAAEQGDPRALVTLGRLGSFRGLVAMRSQVHHPNPWVRFSARRALVMIEGAPEVEAYVREALTQGGRVEKFAVVMDLAKVRGADAFGTLLGALEDDDALVRGRALESLVERFGLDRLTRDGDGRVLLESPLETLESLIMCLIEPVWREAAWRARHAFSELAIGKKPDDLDLVYHASAPPGFRAAVVGAFFDDRHAFAVEPVAKATGHDRAWAESFLVLQLESRSVRAVEAIQALGLRRVVPALEAAAAGLPSVHPFGAAVQAAVAALG